MTSADEGVTPVDALARKTERTEAFWAAFAAAQGVHADYIVEAYGDSPDMANELAALVVSGPKRATAGLLQDYELCGDPLPVAGGYVVLVDGAGEPRAILRTTEVRVGPLSSVDEAFAWDEGEGDRTRADWLRMHRAFFSAYSQRVGVPFDDDSATVFERFAVVWPAAIAD